jgi:hypothetical protein
VTTRIYVPTTLARLAAVVESGEIPAPVHAHAVTDAVRAEWAESSEEEWEYEVLGLAADDCADLWGPDDVRRRVVLAADVSDAERADPDNPGDPTAVIVDHAVPVRRIAAAHADLTTDDAEADDDLRWFASQEIPDLLG